MTRRALVVGAGIGGLAAAIALRRAGWDVRVFERAASPRELGFALALAPNALAALAELGIEERAIAASFEATAAELCTERGAVLRRLKRGTGPRLVVALRPALHGALLAAVGDDAVVLSSEAVGFHASPDDGEVLLKLRDGREIPGDLLIAADGTGSVIRRQMHPDEPPARPSGYCALRGLATGVVAELQGVSAAMYLGDGVEAAALRASDTAIYWYLSLIAEDVPPEHRSATSLRDRLAPRFDRRLGAIMNATRSDDMRFDELLTRDPLPVWGTGRVTLLGDAAHPVLPHTGQGAAQALEDAVALGIVLSPTAPLARRGDVPAALRRYELVRAGRTTGIMKLGRRIARTSTTHSKAVQVIRNMAVRMLPQSVLMRSFQVVAPGDPHEALRKRH